MLYVHNTSFRTVKYVVTPARHTKRCGTKTCFTYNHVWNLSRLRIIHPYQIIAKNQVKRKSWKYYHGKGLKVIKFIFYVNIMCLYVQYIKNELSDENGSNEFFFSTCFCITHLAAILFEISFLKFTAEATIHLTFRILI